MSSRSPLSIRFAERVLSEEHHCLIGDLEWTWRTWREERGPVGAALWLWGTLLTLIPRLLLRDLIWQHTMLRSYLTVALRQLNKFKAFSAINVLGLALSMSVCLLMLAMVQDYDSFDEFHPDGDRLYRVTSKIEGVWGTAHVATSSSQLGPALLEETDGIEALVRMRRTGGKLERDDGRVAPFAGLYAEPGFFDMFGFSLESGNEATALTTPMTMVISQKLVDQLFSDRDPMGQLVERDGHLYEVVGVVAEPPGRSHIRFDVLVSMASLDVILGEDRPTPTSEWGVNTAYYNYVRLEPGASPRRILDVANGLQGRMNTAPEAVPAIYAMQAIPDVNLGLDLSNEIGPVVPRSMAIILSVLALVLIATAVFNYVNLTISRALRRTEELGVRKVMGAHRRQLVQQFVTESIVTSVLSLGLAIVLLQWLIPGFNSLGTMAQEGMAISVSALNPMLLAKFLVFSIGVGMIAGAIPALRVSRVSPVAAFRGSASNLLGGRFRGRKALVVFQFALSVVAITTVGTMRTQLAFLGSADLQLNESEIVHLDLSGTDYESLATEMRRIPGIQAVTGVNYIPASNNTNYTDIQTPEMIDPVTIQSFNVDGGFVEQYGMQVLAGRVFEADRSADEKSSLVVTESAIPFLGFGSVHDAVGASVNYDEGYVGEATIIGVVSDFYSRGFERGYVPVAMTLDPERVQYASLRVGPGNPGETLAAMEAAWAAHAPGLAASWSFYDDAIQAQLDTKKADIMIIGLFGMLIVIIACLGLLGMSMFSAETRLINIPVDSIRFIEAADDYAELVTDQGRHLMSVRMRSLEERLDGEQFIRIHRSQIVNLTYVTEAVPYGNGRWEVTLQDGTTLTTSRSGAAKLREALQRSR